MILLTFVGLLTVLWLIVALLSWGVLRLFRGPGQFRPLARWTLRSWLVAVPLGIFIGLPLLFSWLIANAGTRPDEVELRRTPADCSLPYEEVRFSAADGLPVAGWYLPGEEGRIPVAMTHGLFRNRMEVLDLACALNQSGHPVLAFDLRNHGLSGRRHVTLGFQERLDAAAAAGWLRERTGYARPALLGVSMGAAASLLAAAEQPDQVSAVVADSPFVTLATTVGRHVRFFLSMPAFPFANVFVWNLSRIGDFQPDDLDLTRVLDQVRMPVVLIYGDRDARMTPDDARALEAALPGPDKKLVFFEGADHGDAWEEDPERYLQIVTDLLSRVGGP